MLLTDSSATTDHIRLALDSVLARAGKLGVCREEVFENFFTFAITNSTVSHAQIQNLIGQVAANPASCSEELRIAAKITPRNGATTKVRDILEWLHDYTDKDVPSESTAPLLKAIYDVADDLPEDHTSVLDIDNNMRVLRVTYQLHRRCSTQQERFDANRRLGEQTNSLHAFTRPVMLLDQEHWKWGGTGDKAEPDCELTKAQVEQLEAQAVERIAKAAGDGTLQSNPRQAGILQYWIALGGADGARCTSGGDRGER